MVRGALGIALSVAEQVPVNNAKAADGPIPPFLDLLLLCFAATVPCRQVDIDAEDQVGLLLPCRSRSMHHVAVAFTVSRHLNALGAGRDPAPPECDADPDLVRRICLVARSRRACRVVRVLVDRLRTNEEDRVGRVHVSIAR